MSKTKNKPHEWTAGDQLLFHTPGDRTKPKYPPRRGEFIRFVKYDKPGKDDTLISEVLLKGDAFTVCVYHNQLEYTGTATKSPNETKETTDMALSAKELRKQAKSLNIENWDEMSLSELRKAVADAETTGDAPKSKAKTTKTAPPRKGAAKKAEPAKKSAPAKGTKKAASKPASEDAEPAANGNPYKPGTNMFELAEEVIKGGKRKDMVKRLKKKIKLTPREGNEDEFDLDAQLDRRLLIVGQQLRNNYGFNVVRDGRGYDDGTIVAEKP